MIRKVISMGLALIAVLALGAVTASGVLAAEFHSAATSTTLSGTQTTTHVFTVGSGFSSITCTTATFSGTTSATSTTQTTQTITPTYSGCKDGLGREVHVTMNGCDYLFHSTGTADLLCPTVNGVKQDVLLEITNSSREVACDVTMQEQFGINGQTYSNGTGKNGKMDITVTTHATNIHATVTNTKFLGCGIPDGTYTTASYDGTTTLEGSSDITYF